MRRVKLSRSRRPGAPPPADDEIIRDLGNLLLFGPIQRISHTPIGGYKKGTAYRVYLAGLGRREASFIMKDVELSVGAYPAIVGFPGRVGLPEQALYRSRDSELAEYLPQLYALRTVEAETHHQYYLEDLNAAYRVGYYGRDDLHAAKAALEVGRVLKSFIERVASFPAIDYGGSFGDRFLGFSHEALERFADRTHDEHVAELLRRWDEIAYTYLANTPAVVDAAVHGDFRRGNVFHSRRDPSKVKLVDWEFAGVGWVHNDLASALKLSDLRTTELALRHVASVDRSRSPEEHRRLYLRSRLERGLMDAALVGNQRLAKSGIPTLSTGHSERVLAALDELRSST
jgi:hypothetical protein